MPEQKLTIQLMRSKTADPRPHELTWDELALVLSSPLLTGLKKDQLPAWVPATLDHTGERKSAHALTVNALVLDVDHATRAQRDEILGRLAGAGIEHVYHSTYSYDPIAPEYYDEKLGRDRGEFCYRVIVPLSRPVPAEQWKPFRALCVKAFGALGTVDNKTQDPARLYYLPFAPENGPPPHAGRAYGKPLDVDLVLSQLPVQSQTAEPRDQPELKKTDLTQRELERLIPKRIDNISNDFVRLAIQTLANILNGEPYAEAGERNNALFALASLLAHKFPWHEPSAIIAPIQSQVDLLREAGETDNDSNTLAEMIGRKQEEIRVEAKGEDLITLSQLGRTGPYTSDEVETFLSDLELTSPEHLARQLIVYYKGDTYVFFQGDYIHCGTAETAQHEVHRRLQPALTLPGVLLKQENAKGQFVPKPLHQLVREYGVATLKAVVPSFVVQKSYINWAEEIMYQAIRPRRKTLSLKHSEIVSQWLGALVPDPIQRETLLDWLATAPKLERPTAGLFLKGPKGVGKTLLASGLAAIWGDAPTELQSLGVNFNGDLAGNPIVFADETLPVEYRQDTGLLRRLITTQTNKLKRKYMNDTNLKGSVRVIIAKNDLELFTGNEETLTREAIDALCERLLYIETSDVPGRRIPLDEIAQHILWLEANRPIAPSHERLWVRGQDSALHRHMRTASRGRALVCQWLMAFIERPRIVGDYGALFSVSSAGFFINPRVIYDRFDVYLPKEHRGLSLSAICRTVAEIGDYKSKMLYQIRLDDLLQYAHNHGWPELGLTELTDMVTAAGIELKKDLHERTN